VEINLNIENEDIEFMKGFFQGKSDPVDLNELTNQLALFKTEDKRKNRVKLYDPNCEFKVDDLIYKEYKGKLPVGAKKYIEIEKGVVLRVVDVRTRYGIEEIKLAYEGTSDFKKYTSYLERQKIELLLPHRQAEVCQEVEYLQEEKDPRQTQDPLDERDSNTLEKKLITVLNKEADFAFISNKILLLKHLKPIADDIFEKIKEFLREKKRSETTEFFVEKFLDVKPEDPEFAAYCFALNYRMKMDFKIDFQQTREKGWGKWNLISVIYYTMKDSLISQENPLRKKVSFANRKNLAQRRRRFEEGIFDDESGRYYLTQREVSAGAIRLRPGIYDIGDSIEIDVIDDNTQKSHLLYYYKDENLILGLKAVFEKYKVLQGAILSFWQVDEDQFSFSIRMTKKGTIADKVHYDDEKKCFVVEEEKIASPVFVSKAVFLASDVIRKVQENIDEYRKIQTLNKLLHKVFLEFGIREKNYEIHILRLHHILDLIYPVEIKMVEEVVLSNPEFIPSDKTAGVVYLDSDAVTKIEVEEKERRQKSIEEAMQRREQIRQEKIDKEIQEKEEIRKKREERRRIREEEMWAKERMQKEREQKRLETKPRKEVPARMSKDRQGSPVPAAEKGAAAKRGTKAKFFPSSDQFPIDSSDTSRKSPAKKFKKKIDEDKAPKVKKRQEKPVVDEKLDIDEIKSEIQLEELKEKLKEKKKKAKTKVKEKKVAFQDEGGFGGVFASKLDEAIKQEEPKKKKKAKSDS
jgi:hypothetical protein